MQVFLRKSVLFRGKLMVRVVLTVLVAAGFFITGDIPAVVSGCQQGWMAARDRALSLWSPKESKTAIGPDGQEQQDSHKNDLSKGMEYAVTPSKERLPPEAARSINQRELVAGSRLVLWLVQKETVSVTQFDVIDPQSGEVLVTPPGNSSCLPKRGRIDMNALREGGEISVRYTHNEQSHYRKSVAAAQHETLGAILGIQHSRAGQN